MENNLKDIETYFTAVITAKRVIESGLDLKQSIDLIIKDATFVKCNIRLFKSYVNYAYQIYKNGLKKKERFDGLFNHIIIFSSRRNISILINLVNFINHKRNYLELLIYLSKVENLKEIEKNENEN
jgi:hypothetical protein